ncbi:hypothetical protein BC940DRAFT_334523 [Gongronella butleri]|nr:hypothetical protein BC940DRAFT_334523 [Gongronella butleri]
MDAPLPMTMISVTSSIEIQLHKAIAAIDQENDAQDALNDVTSDEDARELEANDTNDASTSSPP